MNTDVNNIGFFSLFYGDKGFFHSMRCFWVIKVICASSATIAGLREARRQLEV